MKAICTYREALKTVKKFSGKLAEAGGMPIDPGIIGLVAAFQMFGITTLQSCQGHRGRGAGNRCSYPFVQVEKTDIEKIAWLVMVQNSLHRTRGGMPYMNLWGICPQNHAITVMPNRTDRPLKALQRETDDFCRTIRRLGRSAG